MVVAGMRPVGLQLDETRVLNPEAIISFLFSYLFIKSDFMALVMQRQFDHLLQ